MKTSIYGIMHKNLGFKVYFVSLFKEELKSTDQEIYFCHKYKIT